MQPGERTNQAVRPSTLKRRRGRLILAVIGSLLILTGCGIFFDWWRTVPADVEYRYVGRSSCANCHNQQVELWTGSHHDLAMDLATDETVLADFDDASLTHFGITSRMYRDDGKFMVRTEGPDGELDDFEVKYVFGVEPLQQYMVEFDSPEEPTENELGRIQVLRLSWDTQKNQWFYLSPPDVKEKLAPDDPLHWTQPAQNWNHMCADCHSTNLHKNFDFPTQRYHTTFSEIDVSCEACHGPGSVHVQLANRKSLFWDRRIGYGLAPLKSKDSHVEIESCAPCHSRRHVHYPDFRPGEDYYDHYSNGLLRPETYYADGQILDEVYVYGSFLQSKMYHKGIRCTDCHNPHTAELKHQGNQLCVSCHTHDSAKYDSITHHRHQPGSKGALCVECHMPESPFMDIDLRRDHSFKIPRADLSVEIGTPNACTGCHLEANNIDAEKREKLWHYSHWLAAARDGDEQVQEELDRVNRWAQKTLEQWAQEDTPDGQPEFADVLARSWQNDPDVVPRLTRLVGDPLLPGIVRASVLSELGKYADPQSYEVTIRALQDQDPQVRSTAASLMEGLPRQQLLSNVKPLLRDPVRSVRIDAARALAQVPENGFSRDDLLAREAAIADYRKGLGVHLDQASAHMALGVLAERQGNPTEAARSYQNAIRVQPGVTGPRSNLAALLEQAGQEKRASQLRLEELGLLQRDAQLAPNSASVQYRFGLALYLHQRTEEAETALSRAVQLEPQVPQYVLGLALLFQKQQRWPECFELVQRLIELRPHDPMYRQLAREIQAESRTSP